MHLIEKLRQNKASPRFALFSCRVREDLVPRINLIAEVLNRRHGVAKQEFISALFEEHVEALEAELGITRQAA